MKGASWQSGVLRSHAVLGRAHEHGRPPLNEPPPRCPRARRAAQQPCARPGRPRHRGIQCAATPRASRHCAVCSQPICRPPRLIMNLGTTSRGQRCVIQWHGCASLLPPPPASSGWLSAQHIRSLQSKPGRAHRSLCCSAACTFTSYVARMRAHAAACSAMATSCASAVLLPVTRTASTLCAR